MMDIHDPTPQVLIIEDEPDLREAIAGFLTLDGLMVRSAPDLAHASVLLNQRHHDVVVLDLGLPDGDGLDWLRERTDLAHTGVIITSARSAKVQRLDGIRCGADAYLVKPVDLEELALHIVNLTRRVRLQSPAKPLWQLDETQWQLTTPDGHHVKLTRSELLFLSPLMRAVGQAIERDNLIANLGHHINVYDPRRMEIMVRRLRKKIEQQTGERLPVETVYGKGFSFSFPATVKQAPSSDT